MHGPIREATPAFARVHISLVGNGDHAGRSRALDALRSKLVPTSAAAVMIAVFVIFASTRTLLLKELGVGLAVAVFVEATVIRGVLLPATMTVLGEGNWYLPGPVGRMLGRATPEVGDRAAPAVATDQERKAG